MTGIYFDSLWKNGQDIVKFNLVGNDLKNVNDPTAVLLAFKTCQVQTKIVLIKRNVSH